VNVTVKTNAPRNGTKTIFAGNPAVFSVGEEQDFAARLKVSDSKTVLGRYAERHCCFLIKNKVKVNVNLEQTT
jgi:hypothetical protein